MVEENKKQNVEQKVEEEKVETAKEEKVEKKKVEIKKVEAKEVAVVNGHSQRVSTKYSFEVCKFVKHKDLDEAIKDLDLVIKKKKAVPMQALEVAHKKGKMAGGKYPVNVAKVFVVLLKQLKANAVVNQIDNPIITLAMANQASRPYRRAGQQGKRTHIHLEARDKTKLKMKKK